MHVENFKIFSDLVESESFSRAAKLNGITQSAVSQQLRAMEKHFSILIVDRSQKQFRLTREGQKLYESAKEILYIYEKLNSELQEMKKVISGTIHISTDYSIGLHELPPSVKAFLVWGMLFNTTSTHHHGHSYYTKQLNKEYGAPRT